MIKSGFIVAFFYLIIGIYTLPHYGVDWDTVNHLARGQAYLHYFLTGEVSYKSLPEFKEYRQKDNSLFFAPDEPKETLPRRSFYQFDGYTAEYYLKNDSGHPPLSGIISSFFNFLFFQKLGIINDIDSYHLYPIVLAAILTGIIFWWSKKTYGTLAGLVALLSLTLYPLFLGESHFNIKDIPETFFYSLTAIIFYEGLIKKSNYLINLCAISFGLALATKFNILFLLLTFIVWGIIFFLSSKKSILRYLSIIPSIIFFPIIAVVIFFISWPFLWRSPIENFMKIISYYKTMGINSNFDPRFIHFGFNTYALQWIFYTTPIVILLFFIFGVFYSLTKGFKEKDKTALLVLLWFVIPVARVTIPNAGIYGGVRQIMEFIPAMAILSGIGAKYMVAWLHSYMVKVKPFSYLTIKLLQILVILSFLPITFKLISIHPNENVYFNPIIGGLKGAKARNFPYWGFSFGNVYRQGIEWINKNAEKNAKVASGAALEDTLPRIWFRKDIKYSNAFRSGMQKKGEYILELTHDMPVWPHYYYYNYAKNMLKPLYEIKVDDVPILTVWKNEWDQTKEAFRKKEEVVDINNIKKDKNYILLDLGEEIFLTEVNIVFSNPNCRFTKDGYFVTADGRGEWINHPGDLSEMAFYENFDPRKNKDALSYLFPGEKTRLIKVIYSDDNNCFEDIKKVTVKKIPV